MTTSIADIRREYALHGLLESDLASDPFVQFERWFAQALETEVTEPTAMTLATATPDGIPSARIVLMKGFDPRGFDFYTNYESRKGRELTANNRAATVFLWAELQRQVRIEGSVERMSEEESDAYFRSRPVGSRIGAWASHQSSVVTGRKELMEQVAELEAKYGNGDIPRPPYWGGFRLVPSAIEFWQGRPSRMHDRLRYTRIGDDWKIERLSP